MSVSQKTPSTAQGPRLAGGHIARVFHDSSRPAIYEGHVWKVEHLPAYSHADVWFETEEEAWTYADEMTDRVRNAGVGFNHYYPRLDTIPAAGAETIVTGLCGSTFTLEPSTADGALSGDYAATELPTCPECQDLYDRPPGAKPATNQPAVPADAACRPWCTHPEDLDPAAGPDSGCWSDETTIPAQSLPDGWAVQLQSYTLDNLHDGTEVVSESGIILTQGELHPVTMTPAQARQLAAALIAHANTWDNR